MTLLFVDRLSSIAYYDPRSESALLSVLSTQKKTNSVGILCSTGRYLLLHEVLTLLVSAFGIFEA